MKSRVSMVCFLTILFMCGRTRAQLQDKVDSLYQILNTLPQSDTARIKIYGEICWVYATTRSETATARIYADTINQLSLQLNNKAGEALAHFYYGAIDRFEGNFGESEKHLNAYIHYHQEQGDSSQVATGLFQLGTVYFGMDEVDKGLKVLYRALAIHEAADDLSSTNFVLNAIGLAFKNSRRYDEAIEIFQRVLQTDSLDSDVLMNLGDVYSELGQPDMALGSFQKALQVDRASGAGWAIAYDLEAIGALFEKKHLYDSALYYHGQALNIRKQLPNKKEQGLSLCHVGITLAHLNKFEESEKLLMQALAIANEINSTSLKRDAYEMLSMLKDLQKDTPNAYRYYKRYISLKDSLLTEESLQQLSELKTRYESDKKDQEINLLSKENEVNKKEAQRMSVVKNSVVIGTILMILIAGLIVYTLNQRLKNQRTLAAKNDEIKDANFRSQLSELKIKALHAQINPHFIFNCMNSINEMILNGENENASHYLSKFSQLIRLVLENSENAEVSLQDEIAMLKAYIQLEELRFSGRIKYSFEINDNIDCENTLLPSMVLQPFVENAIWYGLMPKEPRNDGTITITIKQNDGSLICLIEDNGVGREKAMELQKKTIWKKKSLGLKITEERLRLISKELKQQFIHITDLKDSAGAALGTRVEVNIPIL